MFLSGLQSVPYTTRPKIPKHSGSLKVQWAEHCLFNSCTPNIQNPVFVTLLWISSARVFFSWKSLSWNLICKWLAKGKYPSIHVYTICTRLFHYFSMSYVVDSCLFHAVSWTLPVSNVYVGLQLHFSVYMYTPVFQPWSSTDISPTACCNDSCISQGSHELQ